MPAPLFTPKDLVHAEAVKNWLASFAHHLQQATNVPPQPNAPLATNFMSKLSHLIVPNDPELNPARVGQFAEDGAGLAELVEKGYVPRKVPMEPFTEGQLAQSFRPKPMNANSAKRLRTIDGAVGGGVAAAPAPPMPPLPPGQPPPQPPLAMPSTQQPPLPPGAPPPFAYPLGSNVALGAGAVAGAFAGADADLDEDDVDIYLEDDDFVDTDVNSKLQQELSRCLQGLIALNWPKHLQLASTNTKGLRIKSGNPFAIKLVRGETTAVPDAYFDIIEHPLDLTTMRERLAAGHYLTLDRFAEDLRLVVNNALTYNRAGGVFREMSEFLAKCVEEQIKRLQERI